MGNSNGMYHKNLQEKENTVLALALAIVLLVNEQINCVYGWMEER